MPDNHLLRTEIVASILKGRIEIDELRCQVQEIVARSHDSIYQSLELITRIDALLARPREAIFLSWQGHSHVRA
jgi:hypothetical protein